MHFKENLRKLRRQKSISQNELADFLGYKSYTTVQKWEDGTAMPRMANIQKIADFLNVDIDELLNKSVDSKIPVVGTVRGGPAIFADENIVDYEDDSLGDGYFYLNVIGDSMKNARILEGDRVCIKKQSTLENGEIGVVLIENEATLKRVYFENDMLILKSENENYKPMIFSKGDIMDKNIQIIGKLIHNKIRY